MEYRAVWAGAHLEIMLENIAPLLLELVPITTFLPVSVLRRDAMTVSKEQPKSKEIVTEDDDHLLIEEEKSRQSTTVELLLF